MPDFLIIGAQKCGTTALYHYLCQHPGVGRSFTKEIHYFDGNYPKGLSWYRAHFPALPAGRQAGPERDQTLNGARPLTGEATPSYLFYPHAASRVRRDLPQAKLIVILRNPIDRAFSQYHHNVRRKKETLPFDRAAEETEEERRLGPVMERMLRDPSYFEPGSMAHSYLARGRYAEQIERWFGFFPRDRFLILKSEDLMNETEKILGETFRFLGLGTAKLREHRWGNEGAYRDPMDAAVRKRLAAYFAPHNRRLYELTGRDFGWER